MPTSALRADTERVWGRPRDIALSALRQPRVPSTAGSGRGRSASRSQCWRAFPGLDVERALAKRSQPGVETELAAAQTAAAANGVQGTPSFAVGPTDGVLRPVAVDNLDARAFRPILDALLAE